MTQIHWLGIGLSSVPGIKRLANAHEHFVLWCRRTDDGKKLLDGCHSQAVRPPGLVTWMIRPPPTFRISAMDSCISRTGAQTFSAKSDCQSSWLTLSKGLAIEEPALLTMISTRPKLSTAVLIIFWEAPSVVTSKAKIGRAHV